MSICSFPQVDPFSLLENKERIPWRLSSPPSYYFRCKERSFLLMFFSSKGFHALDFFGLPSVGADDKAPPPRQILFDLPFELLSAHPV